ncbi:PTS sugar transporter subunit IIA [Lachnospiraceae bacterium 54-53]
MSIINEKCIALRLDASDAQEGIEKAGRVLFHEGYIRQGYIDAMLKNFEKNGPYFAIAPGFAMPHARPEDGVIQSGISLITLKNPVSFGSSNDPVKLIMALATSNDNEHLEFMTKIAGLLGKERVIDKLYQCMTTDEVMSVLKNN